MNKRQQNGGEKKNIDIKSRDKNVADLSDTAIKVSIHYVWYCVLNSLFPAHTQQVFDCFPLKPNAREKIMTLFSV